MFQPKDASGKIDKKARSILYTQALQEINFKVKDIKTERRGWKKISKQMKEKRNLEKQYSYYTKIGFDKGVNIRRYNTQQYTHT